MTQGLLSRKLIIVTGKGGVGKTVVSAALALLASRQGKETLLIEMVASPKLGQLLGTRDPDYQPFEVQPHLHVCNLTPEDCLEEIAVMRLKFRSLYRLVFKNRMVSALMGFMPGMNELLILGKVVFMVTRGTHKDGKHPFDLVILDAPPSGEGISMLSLPGTILKAVEKGPMATDVREMQDLLRDDGVTGIAVVTLPEELPVNEAAELLDQLDRIGLARGRFLFINRIIPEFFDPRTRKILGEMKNHLRFCRDNNLPAGRICTILSHLNRRRESEDGELSRLRRMDSVPRIELPDLPTDGFGIEQIQELASHIQREWEQLEVRKRVGT